MRHSIALVTGTTSGLGYAAASMLAAEGCREVIVTGRSRARVQETAAQLATATNTQVFTPLELELNEPTSVNAALAELVKRGRPIDLLLLNAGMVGGKKRILTAAGVEVDQAPLIGHHQLTLGLLGKGLLGPSARIVIAGSEAARGDVPMFSFTDVAAFAARHHQGDRAAAVEAVVRSGPNVKYQANRAYAVAKLVVAWWAGGPRTAATLRHGRVHRLARQRARHPGGARRRAGHQVADASALEAPPRHVPDAGDRSPPVPPGLGARNRRLGRILRLGAQEAHRPMEAMRHPHFHDRENQEAAWQAVVKVSGVDFSSRAPLSSVS